MVEWLEVLKVIRDYISELKDEEIKQYILSNTDEYYGLRISRSAEASAASGGAVG